VDVGSSLDLLGSALEDTTTRAWVECLGHGAHHLLSNEPPLMYTQDNDGGQVGQFVTQVFRNASGPGSVNFQFVDPSPASEEELIKELVDEKAWMIVTGTLSSKHHSDCNYLNSNPVNPNATASLNSAVSSASSAYNGSLAITVYGEEARNENA
jgi:hypothetical protein